MLNVLMLCYVMLLQLYRKIHAHDNGPCIGALWHPLKPSWMFTCGWDGLIKLWD